VVYGGFRRYDPKQKAGPERIRTGFLTVLAVELVEGRLRVLSALHAPQAHRRSPTKQQHRGRLRQRVGEIAAAGSSPWLSCAVRPQYGSVHGHHAGVQFLDACSEGIK
jgi:hypothetical protein